MRGEGLLLEAEDGRSRFLAHVGLPPVIVGRRPPFDRRNVRLSSILVSRQHVRVSAGPHGYILEDAGSTGGAYLDDERLSSPSPLHAGSRLRLNSETIYVARTFLGASLDEVRAAETFDGAAAMRLARDVLRALRPLHQAGEVHGDLAPPQLLRDELTGAWTVLIHGWNALDPDGTLEGDAAWAAPEVVHEHRLEPASDLYALGLILDDALPGPELPDALQVVLDHLLQPDPRQRPEVGRAIELIHELCPELR